MLAVLAFLLGAAVLVVAGFRDDLGKTDVALVLGSKVELDGKPSPGLQARLDRTLELYRAGWFPEIVVSGGLGKEGFDEAAVMADYLVVHGVPRERVIQDGAGNTTFDSAVNLRRLARERNWKSVFVVTQYFHVPRSRLAVGEVGFREVHSAHARIIEVRDLYSVPREVAGYVSYWFRHYDSPDT